MFRIFMHYPDRTACGLYRARLPVQYCQEELKAEGIELIGSETLDLNEHFDAYVLHRFLSLDFVKPVERFKQQGRKIIWEIDDDLWSIPADNFFSREVGYWHRAALNWMKEVADFILVPTSEA